MSWWWAAKPTDTGALWAAAIKRPSRSTSGDKTSGGWVRIICASGDGSAIIAAYGGSPHGDVRFRANSRGGSTVAKTLSGTVSLRSATREWVSAYPGLRTLDWFEQSRVVHPGR